MAVERGLIVLGDVSGYGEFIATTELEHSREILAELLGTLCECARGSLNIAQLEGDAVFWLCDEDAAGVVDLLKEKFVEFHRRLRFMTLATTCPCRACASVGSLTVKFIVHRGSYVRQRVAGSEHFVGNDLVLAHRLLKNTVPSREYILLTESAFAMVSADGLVAHEEQVEHLGRVRCGYLDLASLRTSALAERTEHLEPEEAQLSAERTFSVGIERIRTALRAEALITEGEHFALFEDPRGVGDEIDRLSERTPPLAPAKITHALTRKGARSSPLGQELHCHHQTDGREGELLRVVRADRGPTVSRSTIHVVGAREAFYKTQILSETPTGSRIEVRFAWESTGGSDPSVPQGFGDKVQQELDRLATLV